MGRLDCPTAELTLRVGIYGHFAPLHWSQVFDGPPPGLRLAGEGAAANTKLPTHIRR